MVTLYYYGNSYQYNEDMITLYYHGNSYQFNEGRLKRYDKFISKINIKINLFLFSQLFLDYLVK